MPHGNVKNGAKGFGGGGGAVDRWQMTDDRLKLEAAFVSQAVIRHLQTVISTLTFLRKIATISNLG